LGISLDTQETLLKYIGGLHSYLQHTILMFYPTSLDEVCVQATHLESRGKNVNVDFVKPLKSTEGKFKGKGKEKFKGNKTNTVKKEKPTCTHYKKEGHSEDHCWILHPELKPTKFGNKLLQHLKLIWGQIREMRQRSQLNESKVKILNLVKVLQFSL
jgi:hypothetical protein